MTTRIWHIALLVAIAVALVAIILIPEHSVSAGRAFIAVTVGILSAVCVLLLFMYRRTVRELGQENAEIRSRLGETTDAKYELEQELGKQKRQSAAVAASSRLEKARDLRILVVEDNRINRRTLVGMLSAFGCAADSAQDGPAALKALAEQTYDLVFIDCQMPGLDADRLARKIRSNGNRYRRQPVIIAVTADVSAGRQAGCLRAGMNDFLAKPIRPEMLEAGLGRWASLVARSTARPARPENDPDLALDSHALLRLRDRAGTRSENFLSNYIDLFLHDTVERLEVLRAALERRDHQLLGREIHALKGACLEFGITRMGAYCDELRNASRDGRFDELPDALRRIKLEFDRVRPIFEAARKRDG